MPRRRRHQGHTPQDGGAFFFGAAWNPWDGPSRGDEDAEFGLDFPEIIDYRVCEWCNGVYAVGLPCPDCGKLWTTGDEIG